MGKDDDNWLDAKHVQCPNCKITLFQVNHSPFNDSWRIFCDACAQSTEISFYDPTVESLRTMPDILASLPLLFEKIEQKLKPCACGGNFLFNSARRCHRCNSIVTQDENIDLFPAARCDFENRDPTPEEQVAFDLYMSRYVRNQDLWK